MKTQIKISNKITYELKGNSFFSIRTKLFGRKYFTENERIIIDQINDLAFYEDIIQQFEQRKKCGLAHAKVEVDSFLKELLYLGIIPISNMPMLCETCVEKSDVNIAGDDQYVELSTMIRKAFGTGNILYAESDNRNYYNPFYLRARCFNNSEMLFYKRKSVEEGVRAVLGVSGFPLIGDPAMITLVFSSREDDISEINEVFDLVLSELKHYNKRKVKLKLYNLPVGILKAFVETNGFVLEAVMPFEKGELTEYTYAKYLEKGDENI